MEQIPGKISRDSDIVTVDVKPLNESLFAERLKVYTITFSLGTTIINDKTPYRVLLPKRLVDILSTYGIEIDLNSFKNPEFSVSLHDDLVFSDNDEKILRNLLDRFGRLKFIKERQYSYPLLYTRPKKIYSRVGYLSSQRDRIVYSLNDK